MSRKTLKIFVAVAAVLLAAELIFVGVMFWKEKKTQPVMQVQETMPTQTEPTQTQAPTETAQPTESTETQSTEPGPDETEPAETQSGEQRYVLTFVGDCTLGSDRTNYGVMYSFIHTIGEDYDYPFRNVVDYFENDDFTMVNLECVFADSGQSSGARFTFRGPTAYTQILTGSSVEAVTLANNHTMDYGAAGYQSTKDVLTEAGVTYVEKDGSALFTTDSGLTIGMYAAAFAVDKDDMETEIKELRKQGAEIVVAAIHWGNEGQYRPTGEQQSLAHAAIDAGVDIVYGSHPHVLQRIEEYNGGIIYYSMGNFSFGGNNFPRDLDSAILQQEVIRDENGKVRLGELTIIPVSCSSIPVQNNFQPTPYEEGTAEYDRVLSKLDGSWTGADLVVNYDDGGSSSGTETPSAGEPAATEPPATQAPPTEPPATEPPATQAPPTEPPAAQPPATEAPAPPGEDSSGGEG